jgi:hypothetical protein
LRDPPLDSEQRAMFDGPGVPPQLLDAESRPGIRYYGCWDAGRQRRAPLRRTGTLVADRFDGANLDGDVARWAVTRVRER